MNSKCLGMTMALGLLGLVLALVWLSAGSPGVARAADVSANLAEITVCPAGPPDCDYEVIQDAVDAAGDGDLIKVATGVYNDVNNHGGLTQVVYISKTLTIRGGYTTAFSDPPDPEANPTTLDAQGEGRVMYITGDTNPMVEGLRITGGDASGLGGGVYGGDGGGGVYIVTATAIIRDSHVFDNIADSGGGLFLSNSDATLIWNAVSGNIATVEEGGGLWVDGRATLIGNTISGNAAGSYGGGLKVGGGIMLIENTITGNTTSVSGGGLCMGGGATLTGNAIFANIALNNGGGVYVGGFGSDSLSGNTISDNIAYNEGGGVFLENSDATLSGNTVIANTAHSKGGGLYLWASSPTLVNNVVTDNQVYSLDSGRGSALCIEKSAAVLLHTTIALNSGGNGSGLYARESTINSSNTILVSHTVGVYVEYDSVAVLEATLWGTDTWANVTDWSGDGTIITGTINIRGDPAFVDPDTGDYHIGPDSAAIDAGVDAGVATDIDGEPRPYGPGYDIGADELQPALEVTKEADPEPVESGAQLTYTLRVTNIGPLSLTATITDILPSHVTPTGVLTWMPSPILPGGTWSKTAMVAVEMGYFGPLTNVVHVATGEGASGAYTVTTTALPPPGWMVYLPLVLKNSE